MEDGFSPEIAGAITGMGLGFLTAILCVETHASSSQVYGCGMDKGFALIGASFLGIIGGSVIGCILGAILGAMVKTK